MPSRARSWRRSSANCRLSRNCRTLSRRYAVRFRRLRLIRHRHDPLRTKLEQTVRDLHANRLARLQSSRERLGNVSEARTENEIWTFVEFDPNGHGVQGTQSGIPTV